ncbi:MAG: outer membrane beta-barrel family protein, partial [Bacteroidota bacterium]
QNSYIRPSGEYLNGNFGFDYYFNDKTSAGASARLNNSWSGRTTDNKAFVQNPDGSLIQQVNADNSEDGTNENYVYSAYLRHQLDSLGQQITLDVDYVQYRSQQDQIFLNSIFDPQGALAAEDRVDGDLPSEINIYAAKLDYEKPLKNGMKFDAGLKSAFTETDNEAIYTNTVEGVTTPDYNLSNQFLYDEWIHAGYVNLSKSMNKLDFQAGLRGEITEMDGRQLGNPVQPDSSFTRTFESLFPTVFLAWRVDSNMVHQFSFSYGRRIDRPQFSDLNPFISPLDRFTFYAGNPDLLPTFSNNFSLTHTWKQMINSTFTYSRTTDGINETLEIQDEIYFSRPGNIADNQTFVFSLDGYVPVRNWWSINFYGEYGYLTFDSPLYGQTLASRGDYQFLSLTNTFQLPKGFRLDVSGRYRSDMVYSQLLLKSYSQVNIGIQKGLFNGKGNLKLAMDDIFFGSRGDGVINNLAQTDADWNSVRDTRRFAIAFSYNFGHSMNAKRRYQNTGSQSEQNRL